MKVYVVLSDSIINGHQSHGLHGVYATESSAIRTAISTITSMAKCNINKEDICVDGLEFSYVNDTIDIYVSCIEQEVIS